MTEGVTDAGGKGDPQSAACDEPVEGVDPVKSATPVRLPQYDVLPRPFSRIMLLLSPALLVAVSLFFWNGPAFMQAYTAHHPLAAIAFLVNLYIFACFWLVYFSSAGGGRLRVQTLRTLLIVHSRQWCAEEDTTQMDNYRRKAETTMTTQAIYIAALAFIIAGLVSEKHLLITYGRGFDNLIALGSLGAAVIAFSVLLIATDAAETMFNSFKVREWQAVSSLYKLSARLKYYGFVLLFLSIVLFTYNINPLVASVTICVFLYLGYRYWFTDISADREYKYEGRLFGAYLVLVNGVILVNAV